MRATFCAVFPWVYQVEEYILVGANGPMTWDPKDLKIRMADAFTNAYLSHAAITMDEIIQGDDIKIATLQQGVLTQADEPDLNTDMAPKDEFVNPLAALKSWQSGKIDEDRH